MYYRNSSLSDSFTPDRHHFISATRKEALELRRLCDKAVVLIKKLIEKVKIARESEALFNDFITKQQNHTDLDNITTQLCAIREKRGINVDGVSGKIERQKKCYSTLQARMTKISRELSTTPWLLKNPLLIIYVQL